MKCLVHLPCYSLCNSLCNSLCWQTVQTGYAKGEHKLLAIQTTPINLPVEGKTSRFDHDVIQLLAVARHPAVMRWGQAGVFCGVGCDGERITTGKTVSDDFLEGAEGRWVTWMNADGREESWRLKLYLICACGDYPQLQAMLPFMESAAGAYCPCRGCNYRADSTMRHERPHSFFDDNRTWQLRQKHALLAQIKRWREHGATGSELQDAGVNKLRWTLCQEHFPFINPVTIAPQDIMHLLADGVTRHEAAWLIYMLHSRGHLRLPRVNDAIRSYSWPRDCRVPQIPKCVEDGATGRAPRQDATIHMSASQTFAFALHRRACPSALACVTHCVTHTVTLCVTRAASHFSAPYYLPRRRRLRTGSHGLRMCA